MLNARTGAIIATRVERLSGFFQRVVGLLGKATVRHDEGVWIPACHAIHTMGMRATIDVIFIDDRGVVLRLEPDVAPNRPVITCRGAAGVVELGGGALASIDVMAGDRLELIDRQAVAHAGDGECEPSRSS